MPPKSYIFVIVVAVFIAIAIVAVLVNNYREKKRAEALRELAQELNFTFFPAGRSELLAELTEFYLLSIGRNRQVKNLLEGSAGGLEIRIFDYSYVTGSGKHQQTWKQSVFVARRQGLNLPRFSLRPETIWHKLGNLLGLSDIDFTSHPTFSNRYLLKGPDEAAIRERFQPAVLEWFQEHTGLNVEGSSDLLLYSTYRRLDPAKIRDFMAEGFAILNLFEPGAAS